MASDSVQRGAIGHNRTFALRLCKCLNILKEREIRTVLSKLQRHWWPEVDESGHDVPLVSVNQRNVFGERPIHVAAWKGDPEDISWLLENGAEINQLGEFQMTPLHYAYMRGKLDNVEILIERGANRFARCDRGLLPNETRTKKF